MGVITYFLLAGYTPFDRENQQQEMQAIIAGDYKFEPGMFLIPTPSALSDNRANRGILGECVSNCKRLRHVMPDGGPYAAPDCL